jgi:aminoglycoside phosphotransferase (APT) family kinase protein
VRQGYTNATDRLGAAVTKTYAGPGAAERAARERQVLTHLAGQRLPVPSVIGSEERVLITEFVPGRHGQDLLDAGFAHEVLAGCGEVLRRLHALDPGPLFGVSVEDQVIVHGDFGPNNLIMAPSDFSVAVLLDWEFCHVGDRVEDLAWCEWIIRAHHPHAVTELPIFFATYGWTPTWDDRQRCMVQRCAELEDFCRVWDADGDGVATWIERGRQTAGWSDT